MHARATPFLALALLTAGFYWKLTATRGEFIWFDHPDMCALEIPRLQFQAREFHRGRFPLWDPHIWMGQPLIGQTQPGPIYPLNLAMLMMPLDTDGSIKTQTLNVYFVILHFIAALGAYLLCRGLKRSRTASILGAAAFSFAGFTGSVPWIDVLNGAIWIPYIAHFVTQSIRSSSFRPAALAGLFMGLSWLSGHHEIPLMTTLGVTIAWFVSRRWKQAFVSMTIMAMIASAQMLSTIEFGRLARRWGPANGPVGWNDPVAYLSSSIYSLTPRSLAGLVLPGQGTNADSSAFLGIVTIALAALAIATAWRLRPVKWLAFVALGSGIFALGAFTPVHGWLYAIVPMLSKARVPSRAIVILDFALVILAAFGADQFLRGYGRQAARRIAMIAAALGALILIAAIIFKVDTTNETVLSALVAYGFFALQRNRDKLAKPVTAALLLLMMITEWHATFTKPWQSRYEENAQPYARGLRTHRDIVDYLNRQPGPTRVRVNDHDVPANFGDLHGIDMHEGYTAAATANLLLYGRHTQNAQRIFAITHYIAKAPDLPETLAPVCDGREDNVKVFSVTNPLPRARAVHRVESVPSPAHLEVHIDNPQFDPAEIALTVNDPIALESCAGDQVTVEAYAPNRVRVKADMKCRGLVVLADTHFPGWQATIDGKSAAIHEAYGALRAVVVEAGLHEIDYRFKPTSVYLGAGLAAIGLLLSLTIAVRPPDHRA